MRILFYKLSISLQLIIFLVSCEETPKQCPNIVFDGKLTTLNGKLYSGSCATFYDSKQINSIQRYKSGKDHGEWTFYHKNGNLETKGTFDMGKRIGVWKYYHSNGVIHKVNTYNNSGKRISRWLTYDTKGNLISKVQY